MRHRPPLARCRGKAGEWPLRSRHPRAVPGGFALGETELDRPQPISHASVVRFIEDNWLNGRGLAAVRSMLRPARLLACSILRRKGATTGCCISIRSPATRWPLRRHPHLNGDRLCRPFWFEVAGLLKSVCLSGVAAAAPGAPHVVAPPSVLTDPAASLALERGENPYPVPPDAPARWRHCRRWHSWVGRCSSTPACHLRAGCPVRAVTAQSHAYGPPGDVPRLSRAGQTLCRARACARDPSLMYLAAGSRISASARTTMRMRRSV